MHKRTYDGIALSDEFTNGRLFGRISFLGDRLHFTNGDYNKELSFSGMIITKGGASDSLIFFTNPGQTDLSFYTRDAAVINDPVLNANADISNQLKELIKEKKRSRFIHAIWILILAALAFGIYRGAVFIKESAVKTASSAIPLEWEEKLGDIVFKQAASEIIQNEEVNRRLSVITAPIVREAAKMSDREYKFKFYISRDKAVNAFALPGGKVVIHSGLISETESPEELAGVLAHEVSHVIKQHSMRQLIQTLGIYIVMQTFLGDIEGIFAILIENSGYLLSLKFSRDFENEADDTGFLILDAARINPSGMITFFQKLSEKEDKLLKNGDASEKKGENGQEENTESNSDAFFESLSTHPDTADRIENLKNKLIDNKNKNYTKINLDYFQFKKMIEAQTD